LHNCICILIWPYFSSSIFSMLLGCHIQVQMTTIHSIYSILHCSMLLIQCQLVRVLETNEYLLTCYSSNSLTLKKISYHHHHPWGSCVLLCTHSLLLDQQMPSLSLCMPSSEGVVLTKVCEQVNESVCTLKFCHRWS